jgi:hypothetical protein
MLGRESSSRPADPRAMNAVTDLVSPAIAIVMAVILRALVLG